jgi:hypothetical protein
MGDRHATANGEDGTMKKAMILAGPLLMLGLTGCVRTVASVVTAPVRAGSQVADWATTSQDEADRNYGRKMREKEAREGREAKKAEKARRKQCREAGYDNCG